MSLSNLHSFHKRLRLQNATAFSGSHYLAVDNGTLVNPRVVQLSRIQSAKRVILAQEPLLPSTLPTLGNSLPPEIPFMRVNAPDEITQGVWVDEQVNEPVDKPFEATQGSKSEATVALPPVVATKAIASNDLKVMDNPPEDARIPTQLEQPPLERGPIRSRPMPEPSTKGHAPQRKASRMKWQPGRGTIEKVDKLTGEIVHLVELP